MANENNPCDEKLLLALRQLRRACEEVIDAHADYDCNGFCCICEQMPYTLIHLADTFAADLEGWLYRTPIVCGEAEPAGDQADLPIIKENP